MKFKLFIVLIITLIIFDINAKSLDKRSHHKKTTYRHKSHRVSNSTKPVANNTAKSNNTAKASNSTNSTAHGAANKTIPLVLNSIGRKVYVKNSSDIVLTKFPFEVTRCDQVVTFKADFIPDLKEYRARAKGFFTLTAHFANLFAEDNANKLLKSVLLSETNIAPRIFRGSGGCIMIYSKDGPNNNISICLEDPKQQQNILEVMKTFTDCRGGSNLRKLDKLKIADMIKTCGGKGKFVNPFKLIMKLQKKKKMKNYKKDANWFHPGSDNVPGTPPVTHP